MTMTVGDRTIEHVVTSAELAAGAVDLGLPELSSGDYTIKAMLSEGAAVSPWSDPVSFWIEAPEPPVVTEPGGAGRGQVVAAQPSAAVGGQVNHKVTGRVTDINRNSGQITIRTPEGGSMKLVLPPLAVASIREGDDVAVDVLVNPARR